MKAEHTLHCNVQPKQAHEHCWHTASHKTTTSVRMGQTCQHGITQTRHALQRLLCTSSYVYSATKDTACMLCNNDADQAVRSASYCWKNDGGTACQPARVWPTHTRTVAELLADNPTHTCCTRCSCRCNIEPRHSTLSTASYHCLAHKHSSCSFAIQHNLQERSPVSAHAGSGEASSPRCTAVLWALRIKPHILPAAAPRPPSAWLTMPRHNAAIPAGVAANDEQHAAYSNCSGAMYVVPDHNLACLTKQQITWPSYKHRQLQARCCCCCSLCRCCYLLLPCCK